MLRLQILCAVLDLPLPMVHQGAVLLCTAEGILGFDLDLVLCSSLEQDLSPLSFSMCKVTELGVMCEPQWPQTLKICVLGIRAWTSPFPSASQLGIDHILNGPCARQVSKCLSGLLCTSMEGNIIPVPVRTP